MTRPTVFVVSVVIFLMGACLNAQAESPAYQPQYPETRQLMATVEAAAELVSSQGIDPACDEFAEPDSEWLKGDSYVFVIDMEGNSICNPGRPSLEGRSLLEMRDPNGKPIVRNFLRELEGGGDTGWVHYLWPRPGQATFYWKTSHVRRATAPDSIQYIVGSGLYQMKMERFFVVEQVRDAVELIRSDGDGAYETLRNKSSGFRFYNAYVFVLDQTGKSLVNVGFPELEGNDLSDLEDVTGKKIIAEMIEKLGEADSAWIEYMWPKPGDQTPTRKDSYVERLDLDGEWLIVGAGVYRD